MLYIANLAVSIAWTSLAHLILVRNPDLLRPGTTIRPDGLTISLLNVDLAQFVFLLVWMVPVIGFWAMILTAHDGPVMKVI